MTTSLTDLSSLIALLEMNEGSSGYRSTKNTSIGLPPSEMNFESCRPPLVTSYNNNNNNNRPTLSSFLSVPPPSSLMTTYDLQQEFVNLQHSQMFGRHESQQDVLSYLNAGGAGGGGGSGGGGSGGGATLAHRKLDRCVSEPSASTSPPLLFGLVGGGTGGGVGGGGAVGTEIWGEGDDGSGGQQQLSLKAAANLCRYKSELCRPYEEHGQCKYGDKCQFAHGRHELRSMIRHPKYKTDLCRTYHTTGLCPYGPRCHFIHNDEERMLSEANRDLIEQQRAKLILLQQQRQRQQEQLLASQIRELQRQYGASGIGAGQGAGCRAGGGASANEALLLAIQSLQSQQRVTTAPNSLPVAGDASLASPPIQCGAAIRGVGTSVESFVGGGGSTADYSSSSGTDDSLSSLSPTSFGSGGLAGSGEDSGSTGSGYPPAQAPPLLSPVDQARHHHAAPLTSPPTNDVFTEVSVFLQDNGNNNNNINNNISSNHGGCSVPQCLPSLDATIVAERRRAALTLLAKKLQTLRKNQNLSPSELDSLIGSYVYPSSGIGGVRVGGDATSHLPPDEQQLQTPYLNNYLPGMSNVGLRYF